MEGIHFASPDFMPGVAVAWSQRECVGSRHKGTAAEKVLGV